MNITFRTLWGTVPVQWFDNHVALQGNALYDAGRNWTREHDPERLHLVGGAAPF